MLIFRGIFLNKYWWQKSDISSQASYRYPILWEAFFDPSDSYFLFADFYTHLTYMHCFTSVRLSVRPSFRPSKIFFVAFIAHLTLPSLGVRRRRPSSVVRRKLFQKSSPLKVLDQWKPNLVRIITRLFSFKIVSGDAVHQPTWPMLLKIEDMVKLQVLGNNSKTVNNLKIWHGIKMISTAKSTYPAILK